MENIAYRRIRVCLQAEWKHCGRTCVCITTLIGAVDGCAPTDAGPRGLARCRKESGFAMLGKNSADSVEHWGQRGRGRDVWWLWGEIWKRECGAVVARVKDPGSVQLFSSRKF
jgi:hypothetical protein